MLCSQLNGADVRALRDAPDVIQSYQVFWDSPGNLKTRMGDEGSAGMAVSGQ